MADAETITDVIPVVVLAAEEALAVLEEKEAPLQEAAVSDQDVKVVPAIEHQDVKADSQAVPQEKVVLQEAQCQEVNLLKELQETKDVLTAHHAVLNSVLNQDQKDQEEVNTYC